MSTDTSLIHDTSDEILDIVDENDVVLFQAAKQDAYDQNHRKRIVHILVIDPQTGHIGIQKRGLNVSWQPGFYCSTACGHVQAGESWEQGAARELEEEMGLVAPLEFIAKFPYDCTYGKRAYLGIYTVYAEPDALTPDPFEVSDIEFLSREAVLALADKGEKLQNHFDAVMRLYLSGASEI